ncbi:hypothetical protein ElyMa_003222600 [Elysia marginata]|uniref:Ig-like domain-containing protein n=1 Tax=Elysia marginata TaxID=1093978 RepID=A0AAV4J768_9GAST|nr:hypothetical protein ElyMa_003222600 [Elysia marginata]
MECVVSSCIPGEYECNSVQGRTKCLSRSQLCDNTKDCHWGDDEDKCDVLPEVYIYCKGNYPKDGYYKGKKISCTCKLRNQDLDVHKGSAQWLKDGSPENKPLESITLMSNTSEADQGYSCSGQSGYGTRNDGKAFKPKFAYLDKDSVMLSPTLLTVCKDDSNSHLVTCKVPKENVNPAPTFSFYGDGKLIGQPLPAIESDTHYKQTFAMSVKGVMEVSCHVTNTVFGELKQQITKFVTLREPPPQPPVITISGQSFQGTSPVNIALLSQNFTGVLTCTLSGGFPEPRIGHLSCGDNVGFSKDLEGTVRFQNSEVTRAMHGVFCSCVGEHKSGCYDNKETKVQVRVEGLAVPNQSEQNSEDQSGDNAAALIIAILLAILCVILLVWNPQHAGDSSRRIWKEVQKSQEVPRIEGGGEVCCLRSIPRHWVEKALIMMTSVSSNIKR